MASAERSFPVWYSTGVSARPWLGLLRPVAGRQPLPSRAEFETVVGVLGLQRPRGTSLQGVPDLSVLLIRKSREEVHVERGARAAKIACGVGRFMASARGGSEGRRGSTSETRHPARTSGAGARSPGIRRVRKRRQGPSRTRADCRSVGRRG